MKKVNVPLLLLLISTSVSTLFAENIINVVTGPFWGHNDAPTSSFSVGIEYARVINKWFLAGGKVEVIGNSEKIYEDGSSDTFYAKDRVFQTPITAWIGADPFYKYKLHPMVFAQAGYNSLWQQQTRYTSELSKRGPLTYNGGFYSKFGADLLFDFSAHASLFIGYGFQIAPINDHSDTGVKELNYNGSQWRFGLSFYY